MGKEEISWRDSYAYRAEYLKSKPGLLGKFHICSQCGRPLWGTENMQVDHVLPPSRRLRRKGNKPVEKTNMLARALNRKFNLAAICGPCNLKKSNKVGMYAVRGAASKILEDVLYTIQRSVLLAIGLIRLAINRSPFSKKKPKTLKQLTPNIKTGFWSTFLAIIVFSVLSVLWYIVMGIIKLGKGLFKLCKDYVVPYGAKGVAYILSSVTAPFRSRKLSAGGKFVVLVGYGAAIAVIWFLFF